MDPTFVNVPGKRTSALPAHSGNPSTFLSTLFPAAEYDATAPTQYRSVSMSGQQLVPLLADFLNASAVSMTRADFNDPHNGDGLYYNGELAPYQAKQLRITGRTDGRDIDDYPDGTGNPLPDVILMQVLGEQSVSEQDAYTLQLVQDEFGDSSYVLEAVSYDPDTDTTSTRGGGVSTFAALTDDPRANPALAAYFDAKQNLTYIHGELLNSSATVAIGTGAKSCTITSGLHYRAGDTVRVSSLAGWVRGPVTSYNASTGALAFTVTAGNFAGSGTLGTGARVALTANGIYPLTLAQMTATSAGTWTIALPDGAGAVLIAYTKASTSQQGQLTPAEYALTPGTPASVSIGGVAVGDKALITVFFGSVEAASAAAITNLQNQLNAQQAILNTRAAADVHAALSYAATVTLDFASTANVQTIALTGNLTLATSNRTITRQKFVRLQADGTARTLTFPAAWLWQGAIPGSLAAGKTGILTLYCFGSAESDIIATFSTQL